MLYDPYFAVWPGLSALASPPSCSDLPDFFMSDSRLHCWLSQTSDMAGCKYFFWCLKNVRSLIAAHFIVLKIRNATVGSAPDNNIADERSMLPIGMPFTKADYSIYDDKDIACMIAQWKEMFHL